MTHVFLASDGQEVSLSATFTGGWDSPRIEFYEETEKRGVREVPP
jgi:hypothetical protein